MAVTTTMPEAGTKAPPFEGIDQDGNKVTLASFKGKKVALYFYPEDFTPGCTDQACSLRDGYRTLQDAGIAVVGVSPDEADYHKKFVSAYKLPFPLLADPDHKIMKKYGTWGEKNLYGKIVIGVKRTTFLIDEAGIIQHIIKRPKVKDHAEQILKKFAR